jgi:hypothetical protein
VFHNSALYQGTASVVPRKPARQWVSTPEELRLAAMAILKHVLEKVTPDFESWVILPRLPVDCNIENEACPMQ